MSTDPSLLFRSELRKKALAARNGLSPDIRDAYSQIIRKKTVDFLSSIRVRHVHSYLNFRSEVSTDGIIRDLFDHGIKVTVPIIRQNGLVMEHSLLEDPDSLRSGHFEIPEPSHITTSPLTEIDAILIPIVAFDGNGVRLGYGKGFYDKFLAGLSQNISRIGLAFSCQEMDNIPKLSHDQLMNNVITEQSVFFFK